MHCVAAMPPIMSCAVKKEGIEHRELSNHSSSGPLTTLVGPHPNIINLIVQMNEKDEFLRHKFYRSDAVQLAESYST